MSLSERQEAAVNAPRGGLFISAGAGSGKTRVLTARYTRIVGEQRLAGEAQPLDGLIAITFTDKAAGELAQRIRGSLAKGVSVELARETEGAWISTIHGLCSRILRRHAFEAGVDPLFGVCDEVQAGLLRERAFERALEALSRSEDVGRLLADYEVTEVEEGLRCVYEHVRSLGLGVDALKNAGVDLGPALARARFRLRSALDEMLSLSTRAVTEENNIALLSGLVSALDTVEEADPECGLAVLAATGGFKQNKGCRACAKPFALEAEEAAHDLRLAAMGRAASVYAAGFLELLERFAAEYAGAKREAGVLDFEDLQLKARDLLQQRPDLMRQYRSRLTEVMVDEFQDTNELQLSVATALGGEALATVGDEKQSIYGWRNADLEIFRRRQRRLDERRVFDLPENFRSHPELVTLFNELFSAEPFWPEALRLTVGATAPSDPQGVRALWPQDVCRAQLMFLDARECVGTDKAVAEAHAVADYFELLRHKGMRQRDFVILLRAMTRAETFESALRARGFDVHLASGGSFFDTTEEAELEALLRTVSNTRDDEAFARLLGGRMANLSDDALYLLRAAADGVAELGGPARRSLWDAACDPDRPALPEADGDALGALVCAVSDLRASQGRIPLHELIFRASELLDYDLTLLAGGEGRAWANVGKLARLAQEFESHASGDAAAFLEYLAERKRHKRYERQAAIAAEEVDAVRIMSVHASKGLEFPIVALPELWRQPPTDVPTFDCGSPDGRLTLSVRLPADGADPTCRDTKVSVAVREWRAARELDEAKRLLYVACTRATEALAFFSVSDSSKPLPSNAPISWIAQAMGLSFTSAGEETASAGDPLARGATGLRSDADTAVYDASRGDARVRVTRVTPRPATNDGGSGAVASQKQSVTALPADDGGAETAAALPARPARVSYTGLQTYLDCSYRYYATYVARVGVLRDGDEAVSPRAVGNAVHRALRLVGRDGSAPPMDELDSIARRAGLDESSTQRVRRAVGAFRESALATSILNTPRLLREVPFGVDVFGTTLDGAMDLLAIRGSSATVVDYKTGTSDITDETLERWRLQAACYALAVFEGAPGVEESEVVFFKPEAGPAERHFSYRRSDLPELHSEIGGLVSRIAEGAFEPRPGYDSRVCPECPALGNLCPIRAPRQS